MTRHIIELQITQDCREVVADLFDSLYNILDTEVVRSCITRAECDFLCSLEIGMREHSPFAAELVHEALSNIVGLINDEEQLCLFRNVNYSLN